MYRDDAQVYNEQGDVISLWTRTMVVSDNYSRNYCGWGATAGGCYSAVVALNTQSLILQYNSGYAYSTLAEVAYPILTGHWYRLEINWEVGGMITVDMYDSDGVTLLTSVNAVHNGITSGGLAFRSFDAGQSAYFDTIVKNEGGPIPVENTTWGSVKALFQ